MNLPQPLFLSAVAARTTIVLLAVVLGIRIFGKRDIGGLNLLDILLIALMGNAVQNAITFGSGALGAGIVSAGALLVIDRIVGALFVRRPDMEQRLVGIPRLIVMNGELDRQAMRREGISEEALLVAARGMGLKDLSRVRMAVLEDDGTISIVPQEKPS